MIKWGIIGTGHMANIFAQSIKEVDNAKLVAVSSKTKKYLKIFGDKFNIKENLRFENYEAICESKNIDAIYISTLNNTHLDLIKLCAINKRIFCVKNLFVLASMKPKKLKSLLGQIILCFLKQ